MMFPRRRSVWLVRRFALALPTVIGIVMLNFFLLQLAPGDAADVIAAEGGESTEHSMLLLRRQLGLDMPVVHQAISYVRDLAHFDLGVSARLGLPVLDVIFSRLPATAILMTSALVVASALGVTIGILMALTAGRVPDRLVSAIVQILYSIPTFWVGLMLIVLFSVKLKLLPSGGAGTIGSDLTGLGAMLDRIRFMVLPVVSLALFYIAIYSRITRVTMIEAGSKDFVRTARAKGVRPARIVIHHVLRNAFTPILTLFSIHIGGLLGGAVVVETVFSWPGLGRLAVESVMARDFKLLLGILLFSSLVVVLVNILVDALQAELDPRISDR